MNLHTVNKMSALSACRRLIQKDDGLLLLEDGVLCLLSGHGNLGDLETLKHLPLFALEADLAARGLMKKVPPEIKIIDYGGFVDLSLRYDKVISWY